MIIGQGRLYLRLIILVLMLASKPASAAPPLPSESFDRESYADQLHGFWLGQSIANWTGLVTEMDRVEPPFYTDEDWGKADQPAIWGLYVAHASVIDFFLMDQDGVWGADDDTDIEYMYQHLLEKHETTELNAEQIRDGWLRHIYSNEDAPISSKEFVRENNLWVSNERAYYLMKDNGLLPPATSLPQHNPDYDMIDAQLSTEIFGLLAPNLPERAVQMANLPIRTTASGEAQLIAEFYVRMHALAASIKRDENIGDALVRIARQARESLPAKSYAADMFDLVWQSYAESSDKNDWELSRDLIYKSYQLDGRAGYQYKKPFDAGINFAASLVSLFFGQGDFKRTVQIGALCGWDSDNPTATWGGLLGFILGRERLQAEFPKVVLSELYWISRTRRNFPDRTPESLGEDRFSLMAERALTIVERVLDEQEKP